MRLIIVSNRLPVSVAVNDGVVAVTRSVGGLATGMSAYVERLKGQSSADFPVNHLSDVLPEVVWVGWPGADIAEGLREQVSSSLRDAGAVPIFVPSELRDRFYNGFCNQTLWPLFHYFSSLVSYDEEDYRAYVEVNALFADALAGMLKPGDVVWVHDYHLLLLPAMLRERFPDLAIGFFLHIPFPDFELFQLLPKRWRESLLEGVLGADVVGFHTYDYTQHFLQCALRILGIEHKMGTLLLKDRSVKADTFPMGIDFARYHNALDDSRVSELASRLEAEKQGRRVLLSIDRLDYTKGIPQRLLAYEEFLKRYPQWRERVVLVMVVTPSRVDVEQYCLMKRQLDETVGHINGKFATLTWTPVIYQFRALDAVELAAYYAISDAALVTPLRDGMNLIAKEYVASRKDGTGVLILSGMAGAAKELGEAIIINPNDVISSARAINEAFEMHADEQKRRNRIMQVRLRRYDVVRWAEEFLAALQRAHDAQHELRARILGAKDCELIIGAYRAAKRRVLLLDYDGTLVEFARLPELAQPDQWLLETLQALATSATVVIVSGRDRATLESWFGALPVELIAEHGAMVRTSDGWTVDGVLDTKWKANIAPILERYADRLPGAFVEEKEFSLAYHYRLADPALASVRTKELLDDLTSFTANIDVQVLQGNKVIEVRCAGASKGRAALRLAQEHDFVLAIGDDIADEDLFSSLPSAHTIRVGIVPSSARHNLPSVKDVRRLLGELARS